MGLFAITMKKALIILFTLVLAIALVLGAGYLIFKDDLLEAARIRITAELSDLAGHPVRIDSVGYIPIRSFSLNNVSVLETASSGVSVARADRITLTVDLLSMITTKRLNTVITVDGLSVGGLTTSGTIRTSSKKAENYSAIFDPLLIEAVFLASSSAKINDHIFRDVSGVLKINNLTASRATVRFTYSDTEYMLGFSARAGKEYSYDVFASSDSLALKGALSKNGDSLLIDGLKGTFYALQFGLDGEIRDYGSPDRTVALDGEIDVDLAELTALPGKMGEFFKDPGMSGRGTSRFHFIMEAPRIDRCKLSGTFLITKPGLRNMLMDEIVGKFSLDNGTLNAPLISGTLYGGNIICDLKVDLSEKDLPYSFTLAVNNMDFGRVMRDATGKNINISGTLYADMFLKGYAKVPEAAEGNGNITISDANLGPMPIFTPLLGNIFSVAQHVIPGGNKVTIGEAFMDFYVKDRKISTRNLTCSGKSVIITAQGYMDFNGNLDLAVTSQFREPSPGQDADWQLSLRNAIVTFGKLISKAHLRGTIRDPKWEFEYLEPMTNLLSTNIRNFLGISE